MRIIGGKHRGRKIRQVGKATTRETADMVRESIFTMLGNHVSGMTLDLFSGSGAYALEALSRGADFAYAADQDRDAVKAIIDNAKALGELERLSIHNKPYDRMIRQFTDEVFSLVFLDPPYDLVVYEQVMMALKDRIVTGGIVVSESHQHVILPETIGPFVKTKEKIYGIKRVTFHEKK